MKKYVKIFSGKPELRCDYCGKNLLESEDAGNYIVIERSTDLESSTIDHSFVDLLFACKNHDRIITRTKCDEGYIDGGWEDLGDLMIPTIWIKRLMAFMNQMYDPYNRITENYFTKVKKMFIHTFPYIIRQMSDEEIKRIIELIQIEEI